MRWTLGLLLLAACASVEKPRAPWAVACPEPLAADVGAKVLESGGNAVDASVAIGFALAATFPNAGNLGGGGFMLVHADKDVAIDYRETAPAAATRDMFLDARGDVDVEKSQRSALACGVPGTVAGLRLAHAKWGSRPWRELLAPAIALAESHVATHDIGGPFKLKKGESFRQPALAATLRRVAENPRDFYEGETARALAADMKRLGGILTLDDLRAYRAIERAPVTGAFRDLTIVSMPPPSSGGVLLVHMLQMLESFDVPAHNSPEYVALLCEIEKRAFADRAEYLGDAPAPAFLTSKAYARQRAREIRRGEWTDPKNVRAGKLEREETTHFSVFDGRMAVANTYTLNDSYGSGILSSAGFLLNNEMDDFSSKPGAPNMYGVTGGEANAVAPGKRMLSSMSPTFVYRGGDLWLILGTPGGPTIITSVMQVILNRAHFGMTLDAAVAAPRFHHQWPGNEILSEFEQSPPNYTVVRRKRIGDVHAIEVGAAAVSDPRGAGSARTPR